jgi:hypothetical protein
LLRYQAELPIRYLEEDYLKLISKKFGRENFRWNVEVSHSGSMWKRLQK